MKQSTTCIYHLLLFPVLIAMTLGCVKFTGTKSSITTTSPTSDQLQHCKDIMYINPDKTIIAKGLCLDYGYQNDATHFKFTTDTAGDIFQEKFIPSNQFKTGATLKPPRYGLAGDWWKTSGQTLIGGDFVVPDPRTGESRDLHIAIENNADETVTVFASLTEPNS